MVARIPWNKISSLRLDVQYIQKSKKMKLTDLESVVGLMAFFARAILSTRAFSMRFYDVISSVQVRKSYYNVRIGEELQEDA